MRWESQTLSSGYLRPIQFGKADPAAWSLSTGLVVAAVMAAAVVIFDAPPPLRSLVVLTFLAFGPGLSLVGLVGISNPTQRLVLSIGVSLALNTVVAGLSLYAGLWSPLGILLVLVAITLVGAGLQFGAIAEAPDSTAPAPIARGATTGRVGVEAIPGGAAMVAPAVTVSAPKPTIAIPDVAPTLPKVAGVNVQRRAAIIVAGTFLLVLGAGYSWPWIPIVSLGIVAGALVVALLTLGERLPEWFLASMMVLLTAYAFLGSGFAYVGLPPLSIGEAVLGLGLLALLASLPSLRLTFASTLLVVFMVLGLLRTAPYLSTYGIMAIRDATLWYYGLFALSLSVLMKKRHFELGIAWLSKITPVLVIWLSGTLLLGQFTLPGVPDVADSPWRLFFAEPGNQGVMLVMTGALALLGLYHFGAARRSQFSLPLWGMWLVGVACVTIMTRGGMLAIGLAIALIFFFLPTRQWIKPAMVAAVAVVLFIVIDPTISSPYGDRTISIARIGTNVTSLFSDETTNEVYLDQDTTWRIEWWDAIWNYTVRGDLFMDGKGFGVNLANDDGYQIDADDTLRSPHSAHLTVLARMGVPGLLVWAAFHLTFVFQLLAAQRRSRSRGDMFWANIDIWILSMWLATMINASFNGYLEGPQGGIWFWAIVGAGLAALRFQPPDDRWSRETAFSPQTAHTDETQVNSRMPYQ